jgi:hypothetical protein
VFTGTHDHQAQEIPMQIRSIITSFGALAVATALSISAAAAQEEGVVNLSVEGTTVQAPVAVAAQVCPDVTAEVLSQAVTTQEVVCEIDQETAAQHDIQVDG